MEPSDFDGITIDELITTLQIYKTELGGEVFVTVQTTPLTEHGHMLAPVDIVKVSTEVVECESALVLDLRL
jgi:hypothetical protein